MAEDNRKGTPLYAARRYHKEVKEVRRAIDDLESFFCVKRGLLIGSFRALVIFIPIFSKINI